MNTLRKSILDQAGKMSGRLIFFVALMMFLVFMVLGLVVACAAIAGGGGQECSTDSAASSTTATAGGTPVYLIGDSIGLGVESDLTSELGGKLTTQATGGIQLRESIPKLDGDKEKIRNAKSVVIELGTNQDAGLDFKSDAKKMVRKVKEINPDATIYWVQIFTPGGITYGPDNKIIANLDGVQMIKTKDDNGNSLVQISSDRIHPDATGYKKLAGLISDAVNNGTSDSGGSTGGSNSNCPPAGGSTASANCGKLEGTPKEIIDTVALPVAHEIGFKDITPESVVAANGLHSTLTTSGNVSDHNGPPDRAWAADISNGSSPTPEMDQLAKDLAKCFGFKWSGSGLVNLSKDGYSLQLIYRTLEGGNHYNHVHIGLHKG